MYIEQYALLFLASWCRMVCEKFVPFGKSKTLVAQGSWVSMWASKYLKIGLLWKFMLYDTVTSVRCFEIVCKLVVSIVVGRGRTGLSYRVECMASACFVPVPRTPVLPVLTEWTEWQRLRSCRPLVDRQRLAVTISLECVPDGFNDNSCC